MYRKIHFKLDKSNKVPETTYKSDKSKVLLSFVTFDLMN